MSTSRRQDREKKRREQGRRARQRAAGRPWSLGAAERARAGWPVERAWVPCPDVWTATGNGMAAVERRQPDGRFAGAFFTISLIDDGLVMAAELPDCKAGEFAEKLATFGDHFPPCREGPAEAAAVFVRGAYALSIESGRDWARVPKIKSALALMPQPPGTPGEWAEMLWEDLTPAGLTRVITRAPHPSDIPEDKEVMIITTATFAVDGGAARVVKALRGAGPDFADEGRAPDGARRFTLTRPYPKQHSSPLAGLGGRQIVGEVEVRTGGAGPSLVVSGKTLSMASVVIQKLKRVVGETIRLTHADWKDLDDLREPGRDPARG